MKSGDYDGLYVTHKPEDHGNRKDKFSKSNDSKKKSSSSDSGKLSMKENLKAAMVTKLGLSTEDAETLWSEAVSSAQEN